MDVAANLQQEFVRIRPNREDDRQAVISGVLLVPAVCLAGLSFCVVCVGLSLTESLLIAV